MYYVVVVNNRFVTAQKTFTDDVNEAKIFTKDRYNEAVIFAHIVNGIVIKADLNTLNPRR